MTKRVDRYTLDDKIGKGNYGVVYKATHETKSGEFAIKVIPSSVVNSNAKLEECLVNEVEALAKVQNCQYIIKYYEMIRTKNNFYFIYEFCNGGNLYEYLRSTGPLPQKKALEIFRQLVEAFKVLSRLNVMHRDLKPDNIFLHNGKVKLGDFGFCKALKVEENMAKTMLGSPIYMAPEVLKEQSYTTKADIWSLGVILYETLYGVCPFQSSSIAMLINKISTTEIEFPPSINVSERTKQLIRKMLNKDYVRRSSWVELFNEKIDLEGNYYDEPDREKRRQLSCSPLKQARPARGLSVQKYNLESILLNRKSNTIKLESTDNKENKMKAFHSQKYMDLLALSNRQLGTTLSPSHLKSAKRPSIAIVPSSDQVTSNGEDQKIKTSRNALRKYRQCQCVMKMMHEQLKKKNKATVGYSYLVLCKVHTIFQQICTDLAGYNQLSTFVNAVKYQMIQINREISAIREEISRLGVTIPSTDQICYGIDQRIHSFTVGSS